MNYRMVVYLVGVVMGIEALLLLLPALVALCYLESTGFLFLSIAAAEGLLALLIIHFKPTGRTDIYAKDGLIVTALSWLVVSLFGALPFWISRQIPHFVDALFETISGFTTTGSSILEIVEPLDHCMLFWRSFTHWIGGMGILVFMLALLPRLGAQSLHLMRAESPGPTVGKLVPRIRSTAMWLYGIYTVLTILCFLLLVAGRMPVFDAVCLTFGAAGTGGFAVLSTSFATYSQYCKVIVTIFMLLFGLNFNFYYYCAVRKYRSALAISEVRWYLAIYFFVVITILMNLWHSNTLGHGAQPIDVFFTTASLMTTTGYGTADFNLWPSYSKAILVLIMFTGACAGSTGGGIKVSRIVIYIKSCSKELYRLVHPRSVRHLKVDGKTLDSSVLQNTYAYLFLYVLIFVVSFLIITLDGQDLITSFTSIAATLNNIGPGLEVVGPTGNYSHFSDLSKIVLCFDMLAGRLEVYPLLICFLPSTWKRHA